MAWVVLALAAFCEAEVQGTGVVDVETDYLPHVVDCENGAASAPALEAQAIAARSFLYYQLEREGSIGDGQGDQVYSCGREPGEAHRLAAEATAGIVLRYRQTQVAAFYVAGARDQPAPACQGSTDDPTATERYVTYNEGLSGEEVIQTSLGWVDPSNYANRGCMSQNGADCLGDSQRNAEEILRFYYGEDIEVVVAEGPCVPGGDADGGCSCQAAPRPGSSPSALPLSFVLLIGYTLVRHARRPGHPLVRLLVGWGERRPRLRLARLARRGARHGRRTGLGP